MDARLNEVAAAEAKARFSELLDRAEAGEEITIRRHGRVVAKLTPVSESAAQVAARKRESRQNYVAWLRSQGPTLGPGLTLKQLVEEGRRH